MNEAEIIISQANRFVFELIGLRNQNFGKNGIGRISILINIGTLNYSFQVHSITDELQPFSNLEMCLQARYV